MYVEKTFTHTHVHVRPTTCSPTSIMFPLSCSSLVIREIAWNERNMFFDGPFFMHMVALDTAGGSFCSQDEDFSWCSDSKYHSVDFCFLTAAIWIYFSRAPGDHLLLLGLSALYFCQRTWQHYGWGHRSSAGKNIRHPFAAVFRQMLNESVHRGTTVLPTSKLIVYPDCRTATEFFWLVLCKVAVVSNIYVF